MTENVEREEKISFQQLIARLAVPTALALPAAILVRELFGPTVEPLFYFSAFLAGIVVFACVRIHTVRPHIRWKRNVYRQCIMVSGTMCAPFAGAGLLALIALADSMTPFLVLHMIVALVMVPTWLVAAAWYIRYAACTNWEYRHPRRRLVQVPGRHGGEYKIHKDDVRDDVSVAFGFLRYTWRQ